MKKREQIQLGVELYEMAIARIIKGKMSRARALTWLHQRNMHIGLCMFYDRRGFETRWISKWRPAGQAWITTPPMFAETRKEILDSLEIRLEVLKKELKNSR